MRLNSKGQVTIPAELRHKLGFVEGDEVEVIEDGATLRIVHSAPDATPTDRWIHRARGIARGGMATDEIMQLTRGE
ncbi:MAG: AbrB family transcriptional regulator [Microbacterium sp. SCN 70-200]|uniref:AbrB/MazE/SpoVT family DNA-binding domain-containing protein n=1 Tax=unclassified Microbacterium TaxID=2609290 RepID=UPI00086F5953|nr:MULTISPECIES: AbrB/MazE/SpoVT family DNA-binding domain-containing protein [unclassified Microbacterium]MBN9216020.1 AbrB/MazE/SpoVT family DNA-binding domain-containing protein [Microbacterium sp.]ODT40343.1 MAG: AbrB family transcriptional regulator [Microbacterium sp. SCN 70-200]OJV82024.1 MAG: AbrB family transcriptional regulator [Microbacterium sp. 70-16]